MRDTDKPESFPLGKPIVPPPAPVPPRQFSRDGTIIKGTDGKLSTNIPVPPPPPSIWDAYLAHQTKANP